MISPRFQKIKYNNDGQPFVVYNGLKLGLDEFIRFDKPVAYYIANRVEPIINAIGCDSIGNFIEISEDGEMAKLIYSGKFK